VPNTGLSGRELASPSGTRLAFRQPRATRKAAARRSSMHYTGRWQAPVSLRVKMSRSGSIILAQGCHSGVMVEEDPFGNPAGRARDLRDKVRAAYLAFVRYADTWALGDGPHN